MTPIFADSCYWIALLNRKDQLHLAAANARQQIGQRSLVTTDEVLTEVLNFFSRRGALLRALAVTAIEGIRLDDKVTVVEQSRETFDRGLKLYKNRADKEFSLVDCVSFNAMTGGELIEALTDDHHFEQAGFIRLLK